MNAKFYTYVHRRADDGLVFYVGKGSGSRGFTRAGRNRYWHRVVANHGFRVEIVERFREEVDAFDHERALIAHYRAAGHQLCNLTDGGEGVAGMKISDEHRAKISAANKGRIRSTEFRAKLLAGLIGRPCSAETREKISAAQRGRTVSQEMRARISKTLSGRKLSNEEKARLYPKTHSAEARAKHSAAMKGRPWSEARRAAFERSRKF